MSSAPRPELPRRPAVPVKFRMPFRGTVRIVFSLVLLALGPLSWFMTIDSAEMRASGATVWTCFVSATYLGATAAWKDQRRWIRLTFAAELGLMALALWLFFGLARLPAPAAAPERAPDFTLNDAQGAPLVLSDALARGPVLLVFFRGHW